VPVQFGDREYALWEEYWGNRTAVVRCLIRPDWTFTVSRHLFPAFGDRTAFEVVGDRTLVARVDPMTKDVGVFLLGDDPRSMSSAMIAEDGLDVAASSAHHGVVIAWSNGHGRIRLRWASADLSTQDPILTVAQVDSPATVAGLKLASSGSATAVLYRTLTPHDPRAVTGGPTPELGRLQFTTREAVVLVDLASSTITYPIWLDPPRSGAATAEWLGPDVWILHGSADPVISQISTS